MRLILGAAIMAVTTACLTACSGSDTTSAKDTTAAIKVAPLVYKERTLANGLRVYTLPDKTTSNVAVHVWYDVGSKDDPVGRSGFAHLFEHIMFKSTRNMPTETFDRLTEDVGGFNNASTNDDFTNYYEVVPANHLERILWAEAERMGSLVIDKDTFNSERDVVKEEFRQRILASPYGRLLGLYVAQTTFSVHPYGRPGIGSIEDLDAATIDDVQAFHATYYRPDNAVLVVSGNFDQTKLDAWVDRYFAPLATPKRPIPRVNVTEPARTSPKDYTVYEANVPLPAVTITWPGLPARHPDFAIASVLDAIISRGESSRLYQSLVYRQQIASEAFSSLDPTHDAGAYTLAAILSEGKSVSDCEKALLAEVALLRDKQVTQAELDEAKNELLSEAVKERETAMGRADTLASAVIRFGDAAASDRLLAAIQATTVADVQRVAKSLFDDKQRVTIRYMAQDTKPADAKGDVITSAPTIVASKLDIPKAEIPVFTLAPPDQRVKPPAAGVPVSATLPSPVEKTLANGLRVIVAPKRDLPIVSANLRILSGNAAEPDGLAGTADLVTSVLTKGTTSRSATDIATQIESLGAELGADADPDGSSVSLEALSNRFREALAISSDVVRNPAFAQAELDRQRQQALDELSVSLKQPGPLSRLAMTRLLFGDGPYGRVSSPKSIAAIKREDLVNFHASRWRPDNAVLVISGDVAPEEAFALADKNYGDWPKPATPLPPAPDATRAVSGHRVVVVDLPKSGQAAVAFGLRGLARKDAKFFPLLVANAVLGGGYSARLNLEIRIKRGLSYGANSGFGQRLAPGPIIAAAQTKNTTAVDVVGLVEAELARLGTTDVAPDELAARSATLIGGFGRSVETAAGISAQLSQLATFGLPLSSLQSYVADVAAVTPAQVREIGATVFDPKAANVVVTGDGEVFYGALKKNKPTAERIPADKLNLDSATLQ